MKKLVVVAMLAGALAAAVACASKATPEWQIPVVAVDANAARAAGFEGAEIDALAAKPLYAMSEAEVGRYLAYAQVAYPNLRDRVMHLARKNLGQPYELYLLGEAPFETYDPQPLYCLDRSDCVVFAEHTYAMALADDWESFFATLQRIRYKEGEIGVASRNHYTEADWNRNNAWLVTDLTDALVGDKAVAFTQTIDRAKFLKNRYKIDRAFTPEKFTDHYVRWEDVDSIGDQLQPGDFVNVVRGKGDSKWVGHVGMIGRGPNGELHFIHSISPTVREEPLANLIARERERFEKNKNAEKPPAQLFGFKFLRLNEDALDRLRAIDGDAAPRVVPPSTVAVN